MNRKEKMEKILALEEKFILAKTNEEKQNVMEKLNEIKYCETPSEIRQQWENAGRQYYNNQYGIGGNYENN
jgi:hypothetical protein